MNELDISPMVAALRSNPEQFEEVGHGQLLHLPSRHDFQFYAGKKVSVSALCDCSSLRISDEQQAQLSDAFREWHATYWRAVLINREFASHFAPPSAFRRLMINLTGRLHRACIAGREKHYPHEETRPSVSGTA